MSSLDYQRTYYDEYLRAARGHHPMVPRAPVVEHVQACLDLGMSYMAIADAAGVSEACVREMIANPDARTRTETARRLLSVTPRRAVTWEGVTRRVRALSCLGWSTTVIAHVAGVDVETIKAWRRGTERTPREATGPILRAYDELSMRTPNPRTRFEKSAVSRAAGEARRHGWVPPLAWDDDTIDDPNAKPHHTTKRERRAAALDVDEVAVERALAGDPVELTQAEREFVIDRLVRDGWNDQQIGARLGVWGETVLRTRRRLGLETRWVA